MSIGEVLAILKPEFSDITVSKIRFLEGAGLVQPDRSASGYRKFSEDDVARLRFVLRAQRDQYLPLRVIRQRLADLESVGELHAVGGLPAHPGDVSGADEAGSAMAPPPAHADEGPAAPPRRALAAERPGPGSWHHRRPARRDGGVRPHRCPRLDRARELVRGRRPGAPAPRP